MKGEVRDEDEWGCGVRERLNMRFLMWICGLWIIFEG
jgi:hypothetical protein